MNIDWEPLRRLLDQHQRFVLTSHVRPDADAIGSEMGCALLLEQIGKQVRIVNPSATPDHLEFLDPHRRVKKFGLDVSAEELAETEVHLILDTSAWAQLGDMAKLFRKTSAVKAVIDHHASSDDLGAIEFKDSTADATGSLVVRMADALGLPFPQDAALPIFCAIATDTGWFRFPSTTGETLRTIGRLVDLGVRPNIVYQRLYERRSPARLKLAGRVLSRVELAFEGRLAYTSVALADFQETGAKPADTEDLVNECLAIENTVAAFIAIEQFNRSVKVSFRSRTAFDVASVAERFGGGGHKQAAGATLTTSLPEAVEQVLKMFGSFMDPPPGPPAF